MRYILIAVLFFATLPQSHPAGSYYYYWYSTKPVNLATVHVTVEGGALVETGATSSRMEGYALVEAPRDCLVIHWSAETDSGIPIREDVSWMDQCDRVYAPLVSIDQAPRNWWP